MQKELLHTFIKVVILWILIIANPYVNVLSCLGKFFTNTLNMRLQDVLKKCKIIHCAQIGFTENHRTTDYIVTLKSLISKHLSSVNRGRIYGSCVDFRKVYDSVWSEGLFVKLSALNIKVFFLNIIKDMYSKSSCAVKVSNKRTDILTAGKECVKDVF